MSRRTGLVTVTVMASVASVACGQPALEDARGEASQALSTTDGGAAFEEAVDALAEVMAPSLRVLPASIDVYSYHSREQVGVPATGALDASSPAVAAFVRRTTAAFLEAQPEGGGDATGFYGANDPVVSRAFGREHWLLLRVRLAAGLSYLDVDALEHAGPRYIPAALQTKLLAAGCDEIKWRNLVMKHDEAACHDVARAALRKTGAAALTYDWLAASFEGCEHRTGTTFVLLASATVESPAVRVFTAESGGGPRSDGEREGLEATFRAYRGPVDPNNRFDVLAASDPWPALVTTREDGERWRRDHLLGCRAP